jgi:hypothetical protein
VYVGLLALCHSPPVCLSRLLKQAQGGATVVAVISVVVEVVVVVVVVVVGAALSACLDC